MQADVVIIGGSVIGCSVAWNLRQDGFTGRVVVVERDSSYAHASAFRAMGGIRQQFCTAVTVQMVQHSVRLWKEFDDRFARAAGPLHARFRQRGYLFLADAAAAAATMQRFEAERRAGAHVQLLSRGDIEAMVPDLRVDDILFGVLGTEDGYAAPREVLRGFRMAAAQGAEFLEAEAAAIHTAHGAVTGVHLTDGRAIETPIVVNAAGAWSGRVARTAGLHVPVEPMRQMLFRATLPRLWPYRFRPRRRALASRRSALGCRPGSHHRGVHQVGRTAR
jgi:glycine/D-amino acid oxidase-like deaminating enzyme